MCEVLGRHKVQIERLPVVVRCAALAGVLVPSQIV